MKDPEEGLDPLTIIAITKPEDFSLDAMEEANSIFHQSVLAGSLNEEYSCSSLPLQSLRPSSDSLNTIETGPAPSGQSSVSHIAGNSLGRFFVEHLRDVLSRASCKVFPPVTSSHFAEETHKRPDSCSLLLK